jgi:hypothetical protein
MNSKQWSRLCIIGCPVYFALIERIPMMAAMTIIVIGLAGDLIRVHFERQMPRYSWYFGTFFTLAFFLLLPIYGFLYFVGHRQGYTFMSFDLVPATAYVTAAMICGYHMFMEVIVFVVYNVVAPFFGWPMKIPHAPWDWEGAAIERSVCQNERRDYGRGYKTQIPEPEYLGFMPPDNWRYQCPECGARVEHAIDSCWNCGYPHG